MAVLVVVEVVEEMPRLKKKVFGQDRRYGGNRPPDIPKTNAQGLCGQKRRRGAKVGQKTFLRNNTKGKIEIQIYKAWNTR
jgi:hypothetical protein